MNTISASQIESVLRKQVLDILDLAKAGQFSKSLGTIKSAKSIYPRNIFIIALEKQLEKLLAMTYSPALTDPDRQKELLESIPNLVHRAIEAMEGEEPVPASRPAEHSEEREAAFARLKDEYFQLADAHVKNGEYQNALQEIKRVLILDPENSTAKEYQKKINEFVDLKEKSSQAQQTVTQQPQERKPKPEPEPTQQAEKAVVPAKRQIQKEVEKVVAKHPAESAVPAKQKKYSLNTIVLVGVPALLVCLVAGYFLIAPEDTNSQPVTIPTAHNNQAAPVESIPDAPKTELVQPAKQESQEVAPPASTDNQQPATTQGQGERTTESKSETTSENSSQSRTDLKASNPGTARANAKTELSSEPPPASNETASVTRNKSNATTSRENTVSQSVKTPEPKAPQLAKLDVTSVLPVARSEKGSPPPISYTERKPQIVRLVAPTFPEAARLTGAQGEVLVSVQIDPQGKPIRAKILRSSSELFNAAVIDAVMHSKYSPGVMPSGPVTTWLTVPFTFKRNVDN